MAGRVDSGNLLLQVPQPSWISVSLHFTSYRTCVQVQSHWGLDMEG